MKTSALHWLGRGEKNPTYKSALAEEPDNILSLDPIPKTHVAGLMDVAVIGLKTLRNVPTFYFGTSPDKLFDYITATLPVLNN
ncbi:hypothetical protein [Yoonia sp. SDW83-1]|uniref:hypothetical protein n=1 Tax=Yoonia sp. SDW83-1 TaxID=3366945 RepID=UPI00398C32CE